MNPKIDATSVRVRLMQTDPAAYFEKLLLELDQLEQRIAKGDEEPDASPMSPSAESR